MCPCGLSAVAFTTNPLVTSRRFARRVRAFLLVRPMATRKKKVVIVEEPTSTCGHCRHACFVEDQDHAVWYCRRYPPVVTYDIGEQTQCSTFPITSADNSCGEFAAKLND